MSAGEGLQDGRLWLFVWPSDISLMAGKTTVWCCFIPEPSGVPAVLQGLEAEGQEQGPQAQGHPSPGWVVISHLCPVHPMLPAWGSGSPCPQLSPTWHMLGQDHSVLTDPGSSPCPPAAVSPCLLLLLPLPFSLCPLFASLSLHTCSSPSLPFSPSSSSSPGLSLSISSYLIPLVFLLSACTADLHARCVEAAQLDLMPPAVRSRAVSGLSAALPRAGAGRCSVHPTALAHTLAPFCVAFSICI